MKKFFAKIKNWFSNHKPTKRRIIQLYTALLYNANIKGFFTGKISTAGTKNVCVPGFNCYSCPGAIGSCPIGAVQNALGSSKTGMIAYVFGIIILFGLILGRTICGFLCPMGLLQDLTYKIKSPKLRKSKVTRILSYLKYVILLVFVIGIPILYSDLVTLPAFCQYICPVGLLAGLTLLGNPVNVGELASLGVLFTWKISLAVLILVGAIFVYRLFCRFLCPLGALYGLFSKLALLGVKLDKQKCVDCGLCINTCKVDIAHVGDHECIQCGECISVCPTKAISWKGGKIFVLPNQIDSPASDGVDIKTLAVQLPTTNLPDSSECEDVSLPTQTAADGQVDLYTEVDKQEKKTKKPPFYGLRKNNGKGFKILACILAGIVLLSSLVYFNFIRTETTADTSYKVGDVVQNFEAKEFFSTDKTYTLSEDSGKIVVLNFWYIGCGGCETEMPHFGALANDEEYRDKVSVVVAHSNNDIYEAEVPIDYNGNQVPTIEKYIMVNKSQSSIAEHNWNTFAHNIKWIMDMDGTDSLYLSFGGTGAWPMTAILDGDGVVRYLTSSSVTEEILYQEIDKILTQQ